MSIIVQDQETSPTLESSRSLPSTADPLDGAPTEASLSTDVPEFTTESVSSHTEATPSDSDNRFSSNSTAGEATTVSSSGESRSGISFSQFHVFSTYSFMQLICSFKSKHFL